MNLYKMKQDIKKNSFIDYKVDYIGFITVSASNIKKWYRAI